VTDRRCRDCQVGLTADNTYSTHQSNYCRRCACARVAAHDKKENDRTRQGADNHFQRWAEYELATLMDAASERMSLVEMAELLGRTRHAVATKLSLVRKALAAGEGVECHPRASTGSTTPLARATATCPACYVQKPCFCD